ncbi:type I secretion system permease/ATPase [Mesorhizobium sp. CA18]|uniref:type I secretion system permease/ATPase n=1 Tax=unclassified Mesorhizobium TaxID=325217 RepID=UPI001CCE7E3C|nr:MULTISPECIES: type I secretion system permease/ATPase [unclassified Mesorhizobium]MBZ9734506.1 type I secretion system permease/ATPase [Mesorhizobium sp. CA9]MBZ9826958.1 type I secretion system permease/ATPase [Mesorhizobium sp. CA18]MBZ9832420.1 type I secretion system permease/ATPase [Mesorhizobium sp. CA2]MBZ9838524.1 type I secretion system permease/ATPase [Mesorhizobium sp. CA3]MBZ9878931.1 type I secretion system permease/ATPase [Mesorhizobium sp. Ca11]
MQPRPQFQEVMHLARHQVPALLLFSLLTNLLLLASTVYMLQIYDRVLSSGSIDTLLWLTLAVIGAIAVYGLLEHARRMMLGHISQWLDDQLSVPVIERAMEARLAGSNLETGLKDVGDLRGFIAGDGILTFLDAPWTPVFLAFMWFLHPALGVVGLAGAVLLFCAALANDFLTRRKGQDAAAGLRRSQAAVGQFIDGAETLRSLGMSEPALRRWEQNQQSLIDIQTRILQRTTIIGSLSRSLRLALQVAVLGLGAYLVLRRELTPGSMIAASILLSRALAPIERSIGAWRSLVSARTARRNLMKLFAETRSMQTAGVSLPRPQGRLKLENLHYCAPGTSQALLNAIGFGVEPGQTCGVIGPSGSGKTTLCRLIVGTLRPSLGHVRLDGAEVWNWPAEELGQHIGYLPQQVELFPGTIAENIARLRDVDSEAVIAAAQLAGIHEMILRLPSGYRTEVGPHGARISRGQRQRIALARALFGDPPLIVLDEPNTGLDGEGEVALFNVLRQLKERGRTVVVISHQTNLLRTADHIALIRDGSLSMFGTRDEVLGALAGQPRRIPVPAAIRDKIAANAPANRKAGE